jgi:hypothetical protein
LFFCFVFSFFLPGQQANKARLETIEAESSQLHVPLLSEDQAIGNVESTVRVCVCVCVLFLT